MRAISGRQLDRRSPHHEIGFTRAPAQAGGVAGSGSRTMPAARSRASSIIFRRAIAWVTRR